MPFEVYSAHVFNNSFGRVQKLLNMFFMFDVDWKALGPESVN